MTLQVLLEGATLRLRTPVPLELLGVVGLNGSRDRHTSDKHREQTRCLWGRYGTVTPGNGPISLVLGKLFLSDRRKNFIAMHCGFP